MANLVAGLNKAFYSALNGNVRVDSKVIPVFVKIAKSGQRFPYIVIGDDVYRNVDDKDSTRREFFKTIHVFSDDATGTELDAIHGGIFTILNRRTSDDSTLYNTMNDGRVVVCSEDSVRTLVEEDENTVFHGILTYRVIMTTD